MTDREPSTGPDDTVPTLTDPVMIAAFEGWNDAGEAASTALEHLELTWDATPLASIDPEEYYDFQVTRPHVKMADGVTRRIEWQTTRLSVAQIPGTERHERTKAASETAHASGSKVSGVGFSPSIHGTTVHANG